MEAEATILKSIDIFYKYLQSTVIDSQTSNACNVCRQIKRKLANEGLDFNTATKCIEQLQRNMKEMKNKIKDLNRKVIVLETKNEDLDERFIRKKSKIADLKSKIDGKNVEIAQLKKDIASKETLIGNLEIKIVGKESKIADFEITRCEKDGTNADLQRQVSEKDVKIADHEKIHYEKDVKITDLERTISEKDEVIDKLEGKIIEKEVKIADLEGKIIGRDAKIANLQRNIERKDNTIADLEKTILEKKRLIESNQSSMKAQKATIVDLQKKINNPNVGVKLLVYYKPPVDPDLTRPEVQSKGEYPWSPPFIKCCIPSLEAGMIPFPVLRNALQPLFDCRIKGIQQLRTTSNGTEYAEVTLSTTDEDVKNEHPNKVLCSVDGRQSSWEAVGRPTTFVGGDHLLICGGGRRTIFMINSVSLSDLLSMSNLLPPLLTSL